MTYFVKDKKKIILEIYTLRILQEFKLFVSIIFTSFAPLLFVLYQGIFSPAYMWHKFWNKVNLMILKLFW